jgi:hypothetical protein
MPGLTAFVGLDEIGKPQLETMKPPAAWEPWSAAKAKANFWKCFTIHLSVEPTHDSVLLRRIEFCSLTCTALGRRGQSSTGGQFFT